MIHSFDEIKESDWVTRCIDFERVGSCGVVRMVLVFFWWCGICWEGWDFAFWVGIPGGDFPGLFENPLKRKVDVSQFKVLLLFSAIYYLTAPPHYSYSSSLDSFEEDNSPSKLGFETPTSSCFNPQNVKQLFWSLQPTFSHSPTPTQARRLNLCTKLQLNATRIKNPFIKQNKIRLNCMIAGFRAQKGEQIHVWPAR